MMRYKQSRSNTILLFILCSLIAYYSHAATDEEFSRLIALGKKPDEDPEEVLIYEVADYHRPVALYDIDEYIRTHRIGLKSPCPTQKEGQLILDKLSYRAGERHRVAHIKEKIISFKITNVVGGIKFYHGHFCLEINQIRDTEIIKALRQKGIINGKGEFTR